MKTNIIYSCILLGIIASTSLLHGSSDTSQNRLALLIGSASDFPSIENVAQDSSNITTYDSDISKAISKVVISHNDITSENRQLYAGISEDIDSEIEKYLSFERTNAKRSMRIFITDR